MEDAQYALELESQQSGKDSDSTSGEDSDSALDPGCAAAEAPDPSVGGRFHVLSSPVPRRQQPVLTSVQEPDPPIIKSDAATEKVLPAFAAAAATTTRSSGAPSSTPTPHSTAAVSLDDSKRKVKANLKHLSNELAACEVWQKDVLRKLRDERRLQAALFTCRRELRAERKDNRTRQV